MDPTHLGPDTAEIPHHQHHHHHIESTQEPAFEEEYSTPVPSRPATPSIMGDANAGYEPRRRPRKLILCFDGTGNKFRGDDSDSNILKIYRMLDRTTDDQYHYYQPGIGTYVVSKSLSHTGIRARIKSWYKKAKDSAVGSSFDEHVVGGYRFLMRFYSPGDEIYIFGFSRGSYIARFLAEMLDHVGLLSHGNEEMVSFAWKAFSQWQRRRSVSDGDPRARQKRRDMYNFLRGFRETFSRPVRRIRFLGLFDTVNSVPQFETAWMERSKFPYTARSSARVIRHAVSIDERRAKFRQDLMYQSAAAAAAARRQKAKGKRRGKLTQHMHHHHDDQQRQQQHNGHDNHDGGSSSTTTAKPSGKHHDHPPRGRATLAVPGGDSDSDDCDHPARYTATRSRSRQTRSRSRRGPSSDGGRSQISQPAAPPSDASSDCNSDAESAQDMDEVWFAGGHGDVGGGWEIPPDGKSASHVPLAWMVREAVRAGLSFDMDKVRAMGCADCADELVREDVEAGVGEAEKQKHAAAAAAAIIPDIKVRSPGGGGASPTEEEAAQPPAVDDPTPPSAFHGLMHQAHTARIHDSLCFDGGLGAVAVLSWKVMEYLPFRRMDLQGDGSWRPIRWPLPCGEVRDIPRDARVHGSVVRRMRADDKYRPGNLIIGGGGRGCRVAPPEHGMGEWVCVAEEGDPIGEVWMRKSAVDLTSIKE